MRFRVPMKHNPAADYAIPGQVRITDRDTVNLVAYPGLPKELLVRMRPEARRNPNFNGGGTGKPGRNRAYGPLMAGKRISDFISAMITNNDREVALGRVPVPLCIWGPHGLGKTSSVIAYAKKHGWDFASIAPAQFNEMGDFHGLPMQVPDEVKGGVKTVFVPPEWVPRPAFDKNGKPKKGILLVDDFNRADPMILKGLMQFMQDGGLFSWKLPQGWQIICTANPENGDYQVSNLDGAMLTRMNHVTMQWDRDSWNAWADAPVEQGGAGWGDKPEIKLVMDFFDGSAATKDFAPPASLMDSKFVTPRSVGNLLRQMSHIPLKEWAMNKDFFSSLAAASLDLDANVANMFGDYVASLGKKQEANLAWLLSQPLDSKLPEKIVKAFYVNENWDIAGIKGVFQAVESMEGKLSDEDIEKVRQFIIALPWAQPDYGVKPADEAKSNTSVDDMKEVPVQNIQMVYESFVKKDELRKILQVGYLLRWDQLPPAGMTPKQAEKWQRPLRYVPTKAKANPFSRFNGFPMKHGPRRPRRNRTR